MEGRGFFFFFLIMLAEMVKMMFPNFGVWKKAFKTIILELVYETNNAFHNRVFRIVKGRYG